MIREDMYLLAKKMVEIPSVNSTAGERNIGLFIEEYVRDIPYFKKHPEQVIVQELKGDALHRRSVFALLIGEKDDSKDTIIMHGHTDTVGFEGFGSLEPYACQPDILLEKMLQVSLEEDIRRDLESGDYMVGRGSCDMKSGDAVFLGLLKTWSEHPKELSGNILVSLNPVEENLHSGIIEGISTLLELQKTYGLHYIMAINNDFICPLYPGDTTKTIYTGVVGKLLPCFYIQGKETHVGQCYQGFDASMAAAALVNKINISREFTDNYEGEVTYPPSVLKVKDLKPWYNVQTASEAFVYFNYFVHNASIEAITAKLKGAATEVFTAMTDKINEEAAWFAGVSGQEAPHYEYPVCVLTYDELLQKASGNACFDKERLDAILCEEQQKGTDKREVPIPMIRYLLGMADITGPAVILYYATPFCPHNTLQGKDEEMICRIRELAQTVTKKTGEEYRLMKFFPSLSDSSYLKIDDSDESIELLVRNFPGFAQLYPLPLKEIRSLNIPAVNYGCYGKDAHKWTERVHVPYTFETLPLLIEETVNYYLR